MSTLLTQPRIRIAWSSQQAEEIWRPRVESVVLMLNAARKLAVKEDHFIASLGRFACGNLGDETATNYADDIVTLPLYDEVENGEPFVVSIYTKPASVGKVSNILKADSVREFNHLMGIPDCCVDQELSVSTDPARLKSCIITAEEVERCYLLNPLLAGIGLSITGYVPCTLLCPQSLSRAEIIMRMLVSVAPQEAEWITNLFRMPVRWSSVNGVCEVVTPIFRGCYLCERSPIPVSINWEGSVFPEGSAFGNVFPHQSRGTKCKERV